MVDVSGPQLLSDPQSSRIGLPDASEVLGAAGVRVSRMVDALYPDGAVIFCGEYIADSINGIVADADGFMLGFPSITVNRMV